MCAVSERARSLTQFYQTRQPTCSLKAMTSNAAAQRSYGRYLALAQEEARSGNIYYQHASAFIATYFEQSAIYTFRVHSRSSARNTPIAENIDFRPGKTWPQSTTAAKCNH